MQQIGQIGENFFKLAFFAECLLRRETIGYLRRNYKKLQITLFFNRLIVIRTLSK
jgi:hypothetical protein